VLNRETEAWNAHDADGVAACYAEDAKLYDVGLPEPLRGRAAIRDSVAGYLAAFSGFHAVNLGKPIVSGNRAATEWKVTGTKDGELMGIAPTGKSATTYGCGTAEFGEDGLIHRGRQLLERRRADGAARRCA
jgi:nuclear transport factor 2 (NTF2) superfamily protein